MNSKDSNYDHDNCSMNYLEFKVSIFIKVLLSLFTASYMAIIFFAQANTILTCLYAVLYFIPETGKYLAEDPSVQNFLNYVTPLIGIYAILLAIAPLIIAYSLTVEIANAKKYHYGCLISITLINICTCVVTYILWPPFIAYIYK